ncbi:MAG: HU family DNA-binding protein [Bacteroidales bacterium]|jgi:DNA-binding protein HU-beta|nr:HU family DNA-binding protein [Bacteroidales bacterium]
MAEKAGMSKTDAQKAFEAFLGVTKEYLQAGEKVSFLGFGAFSVQEKAERMAKNPRTGEMVKVPAKKVVKFKAGSELSANL